MDKLLIIGAGIGQVPLLQKAQKRGIHVTVASIPGSYPCLEMADDVIYKDIYDRDGIVEEAKWRGITAVISDQNDLVMPTVAYVAEKLGLPGNKFETVVSYCNKNLFRDICDKAGVPGPKHIAVNVPNVDASSSLLGCPFPWIVKPSDSQSSIGVCKVNNKEELQLALQKALKKSPTHSAIVEEFFLGSELVCEGFINDGQYYLLQFGDRRYFRLSEAMIPCQTLFPSNVDQNIQKKIVAYENVLAEFTHPSFAIVHSEYLVNESTGEIRIVESALRGGGVYISSDLIPMATSIDINDVLLSKALGEYVNVDEVFCKRRNKASAYLCFYLNEGIVKSVSGVEELKAMPFVKEVFLDDISVGKKSGLPTYKGARKGPILVSGIDRDDLKRNILAIQEVFHIEVVDKTGFVSDINWE